MIESEFFLADCLAIDFKYPLDYTHFVKNQDPITSTPWWLIGHTKGAFNISFETINTIYKSNKLLIPFAKSDQSNILACFDKEHRVWLTSCEVNDITDSDWDSRAYFDNFNSWLQAVKEGEIF